MISIECDNCDLRFEVDEDRVPADGKIACPSCGDINRIARSAGGPAAAAPARAAGAEDETERNLCVVRPAMFRAHPFRYALIVVLAVGGLVGGIAIPRTEGIWDWLSLPCYLASIAAIGWFGAWWLASHLWIKVTISNKRTVRYEGIIRRHSTEVLHDHVRSVDINQNFVQRLLNVGYIGIDSAGQDGIEIEIRDIPGPYEVKKIIDQYRAM